MAILKNIPAITIDGRTYNEYDFFDISLVQELSKPNEFRFSMQKKSLEENDNDAKFSICKQLLGAKVICKLRTHKNIGMIDIPGEYLEFSGIIIRANGHRSTRTGGNIIEVTAYSPDYLLLDSPHCQSFEDTPLKKIVSDVLNESLTIDSQIEPAMADNIPYTVCYNENSYQFLARLARRYGEWFYYDGTTLVFGHTHKQKETINLLYPDVDLYDYQYNIELEHLSFQHATHNYLNYENTTKKASEVTNQQLHPLTDNAYNKSKEIFKKNTLSNLHNASFEQENNNSLEISLKSQGLQLKAQLMVCNGRSSRADLRLGSKIKIKEKYKTENRTVEQEELIICRLVHSFNIHGDYINEFTSIPSKSEFPPYSEDGLDYPIAETQRAIVKKNNDPEKLGRIRVQFLWQEGNEQLTPWLRITQPHGGADKGFYFIPEIEEEVMVGFEMGNAEKPYIIGTLYHGKQHPGSNWPDGSNNVKAIRTRNGHTVEIHDKGAGGFIKIYDNNTQNYVLTFSTDDKLIRLQSVGNIELSAGNDIIIKAGNNINMTAGTDFSRDAGNNINDSAGKDISSNAGYNINDSAGKDISIDAGEGITANAGKDITTNAGGNSTTDAGKNIKTCAGESITADAGKDMETSVGGNNKLNVSQDYILNIEGNKEEDVGDEYRLDAKNITQVASVNIEMEADSNWSQSAGKKMIVDGGSDLNIIGDKVKIN